MMKPDGRIGDLVKSGARVGKSADCRIRTHDSIVGPGHGHVVKLGAAESVLKPSSGDSAWLRRHGSTYVGAESRGLSSDSTPRVTHTTPTLKMKIWPLRWP